MAAMGAFLGWRGVFSALFLGSLLGSVAIGVLMLRGKLRRGDYLPFGPFLALGSWTAWTAGPAFSAALFSMPGLPFR
jgi:leader peptidase (prepilin peptidase)/N-methyltransferase